MITIIGCSDKNNLDMSSVEIEMFQNIKNAEFSATSPKLLYATEVYAVILDTEGLIIYDINEDRVNHVIDVRIKGFNNLQGSVITESIGNNNNVILKNLGDMTNYLEINMKSGDNEIVSEIDIDKYKVPEIYHLSDDETEKIKGDILNEIESIKVCEEIIAFTSDYKAQDKDWKLIVFNKDNLSKRKVLKIFKSDY